jgi:transcriptional regulator with XRE-family HTH domain
MTAVPTWQAWLGAAIQAARQQAELTQAEVAARLGVRQSSVSQWERGTTAPTTKHLLVLQQLLGPALVRQLLGEDSPDAGSCCSAGFAGDDLPAGTAGPRSGATAKAPPPGPQGRGPARALQMSEAAMPVR